MYMEAHVKVHVIMCVEMLAATGLPLNASLLAPLRMRPSARAETARRVALEMMTLHPMLPHRQRLGRQAIAPWQPAAMVGAELGRYFPNTWM
jgi:hypothetical protein